MTLLTPLTFVGLLAGAGQLQEAPGIQVIKITFDEQCQHTADTRTTAKKQDRDVVIWRVVNECKDAQELTIKPKRINPFAGCVGDPKNFKIGSRFRIDGATTGKVKAYLVCTVDWTKAGNHKFKIDTPHQTQHVSPEPLEHELALDVVP